MGFPISIPVSTGLIHPCGIAYPQGGNIPGGPGLADGLLIGTAKNRSIPVRTGLTLPASSITPRAWVYPRKRGANRMITSPGGQKEGISPQARG